MVRRVVGGYLCLPWNSHLGMITRSLVGDTVIPLTTGKLKGDNPRKTNIAAWKIDRSLLAGVRHVSFPAMFLFTRRSV